jgi:dihydrofolate synthase/folylpolyglutamate synthase
LANDHIMTAVIETYEQAIEFLYGRINYERAQPEAYSSSDFKLDRMRGLLEALAHPEERLPAIHVAGTKGKGSTCSMLAGVLTLAGLRAGLYTSPHLTRLEERFRVAGVQPSPEQLVALVNQLQPVVERLDHAPAKLHPTYFELATALAWLYFLEQGARVAVLETGLGGRLDSTNLCRPWVTTITNVSRDHMHILGSTVGAIAVEKAGIIKPGVPVVSGCLHPDAMAVMAAIAQDRDAPLWQLNRDITWSWRDPARRLIDVSTPRRTWEALPVPLRGEHQAVNTALAVATLDQLPEAVVTLTPDLVRAGLAATSWPARVELIGHEPTVILDAAHNWASAKALAATLEQEFTARRRVLVFACSRDKDYRGLLRQLAPRFDTIIFTRYVDNPRAVDPDELRDHLELLFDRPAHVVHDPVAAWKLARRLAHATDLIVITGSLFLVGELRELLLDEHKAPLGGPGIAIPGLHGA